MRQSMEAPRYKRKAVKARLRNVKDTAIAKKAGSARNLTQWLLDNQTGEYAAGYDDFFSVTFLTVLLMGLRAACMEYVLVPLAKRWGISTRKEAIRFSEQGWMLTYYSVLWPLGLYIYYTSPYFLNMEELWTNWPQRELDGLMKGYILVQWAFWSQQVLVIHIETRRKDYWQILTHHFVTIALIAASYAYHHTRVGHVILVLMDVIELIFPLAKCLKYLGFTTACDVVFGVFMITWFISRHVFYPMVCWSIYADLPRLLRSACYRGTADNLQGQPIEEEVGVEGIDLKQWERRSGVKGATSSTAISFSRHGDRKELLNRIGCEKQID
ncbi:hypothetical protein DL765_010987 [Monosporascus sp. GIB2]|nr:hypothetical protein DL765_010987 [Monosporascus sp. GIB2]